jgi:hypothetical protein
VEVVETAELPPVQAGPEAEAQAALKTPGFRELPTLAAEAAAAEDILLSVLNTTGATAVREL